VSWILPRVEQNSEAPKMKGVSMTEKEFQLVAALQRLRDARQLVADAQPHLVRPELKGQWDRTVRAMQGMIEVLETDAKERIITTQGDPRD
jgi:hypothetical protein